MHLFLFAVGCLQIFRGTAACIKDEKFTSKNTEVRSTGNICRNKDTDNSKGA
jgi:hypothetical protein